MIKEDSINLPPSAVPANTVTPSSRPSIDKAETSNTYIANPPSFQNQGQTSPSN